MVTSQLVDDINVVLDQCNHMIEAVNESKKVSNAGAEGVRQAVKSMETIAETNKVTSRK